MPEDNNESAHSLQAISAKIKRIVGQFDGNGDIEQFLCRIQVASEIFGEKTTVGAMPFVLEDRAFSVGSHVTPT